jgi:type II secretory pathway pseudopilin PulG
MGAVAIIGLVAAIAIPNIVRGRISANESAAVRNLQALISSLEMYRAGNNRYPDAWDDDLYTSADPDYGPPAFDNGLSDFEVQGYRYTYTPGTDTYDINANPSSASTGNRSFWGDETAQVYHCTGDITTATRPAGAVTLDQPPMPAASC